jgi:hypothetical protein
MRETIHILPYYEQQGKVVYLMVLAEIKETISEK